MTPTFQNITPRHSVSQRGSISPTTTALTLGIVVIASIAFLSFFYLGQVQSTAARGTDVQALEEQLQQLRERQRNLELEGAQLRSIQAIEEKAFKLNLIATDQFAYLAGEPERIFTLAP
ncbi:MAG: hypothetical protein ABIH36_00040 [bacterium]